MMMERNDMGCYWCKVKDKNLYDEKWGYTHNLFILICSSIEPHVEHPEE